MVLEFFKNSAWDQYNCGVGDSGAFSHSPRPLLNWTSCKFQRERESTWQSQINVFTCASHTLHWTRNGHTNEKKAMTDVKVPSMSSLLHVWLKSRGKRQEHIVGKPHAGPDSPAPLKSRRQPWLVWLSGLSTSLRTKGSLLNSQSKHMPGLQARSPVGACERQPHIDVSLPLFLPPFPSLYK